MKILKIVEKSLINNDRRAEKQKKREKESEDMKKRPDFDLKIDNLLEKK